MPKHKSEDYKLSAVNYYLTENNNQFISKSIARVLCFLFETLFVYVV